MASSYGKSHGAILPPIVNRILYVRNLPFKISAEELYDLFGKYGAIRQIRLGTEQKTRGSAYVVYEDIYDAKDACDNLQGFNVQGRYLVVLYHQANSRAKLDLPKEEERIEQLRRKYNSRSNEEDEDSYLNQPE
ncbi:Splicing factor 3B subunit 6 [Coemansia sp. RSA 2703]|nr:Splicing factor 3B subunit 6 [Coemansia sp. RSA 2703]